VNHRIVAAVVGLIIVMLVGTALAFAWAVQAQVPAGLVHPSAAAIPHPVSGRTAECSACHAGDLRMPPTHRYFTDRGCLSCHAWLPIGLVPHSVSMGDARCPPCHGDPDSDFGMPRDHLAFHEKRCSFCHDVDPAKASVEPRPAGESASAKPELTHPITGAFANCLYCHRIGSKPSLPRSHEAFTQATCVWCHIPSSNAATSTP